MNENDIHSEGTAPNEQPKSRKGLKIIAAVAAVAVVAGAVAFLLLRKPETPEPPATEPPTTEATEPPTEAPTERVMLENMAELYAQNPEIVGWVRIEDTKLDYPVMYNLDEGFKYLHLTFDGKKAFVGTPFVDKGCLVDPESQNLIIHGHNMKNGTGFRAITGYTNESYWEEHPTIFYSTLYEEREYEVIAVIRDRVYKTTDTCFKFYEFIDPETEEEFIEGIEYFKEHSLYDIEATAEYGDKLLTLVTCAYHTEKGRLVVLAREITDAVEDVTETAG